MSRGKRLTPEFRPDELATADDIAQWLVPMKPKIGPVLFLLFVTEAILATICCKVYADTDWLLKFIFTQLLSINVTLCGLLHFFPPMFEFYTSMIFLPFKSFWLYTSGLGLLSAGIGLIFDKTQVYSAWGLVALFILMLPGNLTCVFQERPRRLVSGGSLPMAIIRLPMQYLFIQWALWFTTPPLVRPF